MEFIILGIIILIGVMIIYKHFKTKQQLKKDFSVPREKIPELVYSSFYESQEGYFIIEPFLNGLTLIQKTENGFSNQTVTDQSNPVEYNKVILKLISLLQNATLVEEDKNKTLKKEFDDFIERLKLQGKL